MKLIKFAIPLFTIVIFITVIVGVFNNRSSAASQPILFSHNLHVEGQDMDCTECHTQVNRYARASLPDISICIDCHSDPLTETETEEQLLVYTTEEREIPWKKIYKIPDHVYFSHRRHVTLGNITCEQCHGDVTNLTKPFTKPLIPITMDNCMECHEDHSVTNDCLACHR